MTANHIVFVGTVQGVGFRFTAHRIALRCGLTGYVKNLPAGTVEMFVQGEKDDITNCIKDIGETFGGYIRDVKITETAPNPRYNDFRIEF